jgi:hypothetical protein
MADFIRADLRGSRFEHVDLSGAQLRAVDLTGARLRAVDLTGVVMRNVELAGADIHGEIGNLTINGVDIGPLVDAELDRRYPDRAKMRPAGPAGFREAWEVLERLWGQSVERARRLPPELLHESVDGEWSFIETLRHLVFVTDATSMPCGRAARDRAPAASVPAASSGPGRRPMTRRSREP